MDNQNIPFFDLHVHASPDTYARRYTAITLGEEMRSVGAGAVIKSHLTATTAVANLAREQGLPIYGSVTLNRYAGGISMAVVQAALAANGQDAPMVIWFPTLTGHGCQPRIAQNKSHPILDQLPVLEERVSEGGRLRQETIDVIKLAAEQGIPMATGHSSKHEVYLLVEEVGKHGGRLMLTHPCHPCTGLSVHEVTELMKLEHVWTEVAILMTRLGYERVEDVLELLEHIGPERVCVSTDFGQVKNPPVSEGYAWFAGQLKEASVTRTLQVDDPLLKRICRTNPMRFLGLDKLGEL